MNFGLRMRKARERWGLSQIEAANKLGISSAVLSNYERNKREPDVKMLKKIAEIYDISVDYLLGITDELKPIDKEDEFLEEINDPELFAWWEDLPKNKEEELKKLREMWNIMQRKEN